nr:MAG TPA: hypothetical protein [Caudoviricetes sp.]
MLAASSCAGRGSMTNHIFIYIAHVYLLERGETHVV